jgi:hypothetical protein
MSTRFLIILSLLYSQLLYSQQYFEFEKPDKKLPSKFKSIIVLDSRPDTTKLGVIQKGLFNNKVSLVSKNTLPIEISKYFNALILPMTDANDTMLLNIREFYFTELTGSSSEKGYCRIRAELFFEQNGHYELVDKVDRVLEVTTMLDVTKKNINNGVKVLMDIIRINITANKTGDAYSLNQIKNLNKFEKSTIPVFLTDTFKSGIYFTYREFANQTPSVTNFTIKKNKSETKIEKIVGINKLGKELILDKDLVYCIVENNVVQLSTNNGLQTLYKEDGDFYFKGKTKVTANGVEVATVSLFFGVIGGVLATNATAIWLQKIDHISGAIVPVKEIK